MKKEDIKVCILRVGGTNCDEETKRAFEELRVDAKIMHLKEIVKKKSLLEYNVLVLPGGFSYGDYVRAGSILAKRILTSIGSELKKFIGENRPILGICNGFQVLIESGLLPGFEGISLNPKAALAKNFPPNYNCRWVYLKHENKGKCIFTNKIPKGRVMRIPIAHSEGRFIFEKRKEQKFLAKLYENDQLVFSYCNKNGEKAEKQYPTNPNGSFHDIAGICNPEGTIFGLMPHPERAYYWWQHPDWTTKKITSKYGDGKIIFENLIKYLIEKS